MRRAPRFHNWISWFILLLPPAMAFLVWLSALSFVPVPWPDDSAFYLVARDLFQWPPRWVMISQSPFEPSYRIFNFNTMPLYPTLIGLGRLVGIDGSFALKIWPLTAWALSGVLIARLLVWREKVHGLLALAFVAAFAFDPVLRWASVLIRPESLVGLAGTALVAGLTFGFPEKLRRTDLWWWDPCAALLAFAAYAHFNAIHLLFPVVATFVLQPRRLLQIGAKTALYLSPWIALVLSNLALFETQMATQWARLAIPNHWLSSPAKTLAALNPEMGSPIPLSGAQAWAIVLLAVLILLAFASLIYELIQTSRSTRENPAPEPNLIPAGAWVVGSVWLWHTKPEVWFVYFIHLSTWFFAATLLALLWRKRSAAMARTALVTLTSIVAVAAGLQAWASSEQLLRLSESESWRWSTYHRFVDCIDARLSELAKAREISSTEEPAPFRVWGPTFPDVLVELSRRHPNWEFTRTNDFSSRANLAVKHGHDVDAVVVTETLRWEEREISAPASEHPELVSVWMTWKDYFLYRLWTDPEWKRERYICQRGRWQAFLFMNGTSSSQ